MQTADVLRYIMVSLHYVLNLGIPSVMEEISTINVQQFWQNLIFFSGEAS
jgi:hypothetical protein